jgi:adenylate kinase family enzyme
MQFPIFKTKIEGLTKKFDLSNPKERGEYFKSKAGPEIEKLKKHLKNNTFIAYPLGKKNSGKGTYAKMFGEVVGPELISHFSVGDMVRNVDEELKDEKKKKELIAFLEKNYRGWLPFEKILEALENRSTKTLLPTELILALVKREIARREKKSIFIDGFPRDLDQISYSLFLRDLIGYRDDPDVLILIDVPEAVIDERIKWRRVCPVCQTSRNLKLLPTSKIGYDEKEKELAPYGAEGSRAGFFLLCDNPACQGARMVAKEGDEFGNKPIRERLKKDEQLMEQAAGLYGIPKIFLRNSLPLKSVGEYVDDYEITPEYVFEWDEKNQKVKITEKPWVMPDDNGVSSVSLLAAPVVVSLIKQMAQVLGL